MPPSLRELRRSARIRMRFLFDSKPRQVYRMLRRLGFSRTKALARSTFHLGEQCRLLRESGLRLMTYEALRDPWHPAGSMYFGKAYVKRGASCVVDIGAHRGSWLQACHDLLQPKTIVAFEPNPEAHQGLETMRASLAPSTLRVERACVGDKPGTVDFHMTDRPDFNSALAPKATGEAGLAGYGVPETQRIIQTAQVTLDDALADIPVIDFLKIDTQGYEVQVLKGATEVLKRTSVITVELNMMPLYEGGSTMADVHGILLDAGFRLVELDAPSRNQGVWVWTDGLYVAERLLPGSSRGA